MGAVDDEAARKREKVLESQLEGRCEGGDDDVKKDGVGASYVDASIVALKEVDVGKAVAGQRSLFR